VKAIVDAIKKGGVDSRIDVWINRLRSLLSIARKPEIADIRKDRFWRTAAARTQATRNKCNHRYEAP
jgi:hypothetical protein